MHLEHQMPNLWYEAHLRGANLDVAGVTLPGMPFVIVGHNQRIAWGFTNVGPTVTDVYVENFNAQGAYQTPLGWVQPEHRTEVIHVKGKPDVSLDVKITRNGPLITELIPGQTRPLALRWTLYDGLRIPFFDENSATRFPCWMLRDRTSSMPTSTATLVIRLPARSRFEQPATGAFPPAAPTMRMNGPDTFRLRSCRVSTILRRESSPRRTGESHRTDIRIRSVWNGRLPGAPRAFITCWSQAENSPRLTCWHCRPTFIPNRICSPPSGSSMRWITLRSPRRAPSKPPTS